MKTAIYTCLTFQELEELIEKNLGIPVIKSNDYTTFDNYSVIRDLECNNDSYHTFGNDYKAVLAEHDGGYGSITNRYVALLMEKGVISSQHEVLLSISW